MMSVVRDCLKLKRLMQDEMKEARMSKYRVNSDGAAKKENIWDKHNINPRGRADDQRDDHSDNDLRPGIAQDKEFDDVVGVPPARGRNLTELGFLENSKILDKSSNVLFGDEPDRDL